LGGPLFVSGLGYAYGDGSLDEVELVARFDGRVGSRVPHAWVEQDGVRMSTLDFFGREFVLLVRGGEWNEAASAVAADRQVEIAVIDVAPTRLKDAEPWAKQIDLTAGTAILVRPDGFVAWRCAGPKDPRRALDEALAMALNRVAWSRDHRKRSVCPEIIFG
jgi:hypothetical protein